MEQTVLDKPLSALARRAWCRDIAAFDLDRRRRRAARFAARGPAPKTTYRVVCRSDSAAVEDIVTDALARLLDKPSGPRPKSKAVDSTAGSTGD